LNVFNVDSIDLPRGVIYDYGNMKKTFFYGWVIVFVLFLLQMIMYGPRGSFGVFIIPITSDFHWSRALVAGAFSVSSLVTGLASIVMGWLNDRLGPRIVLTICGFLVGAGLMLMFFVHAAWQLYLFYVVPIGLGMGGLYSPQMSTVARWFVKRRNIMTGVLMAGGGLGGLIFPPLITRLIYTYDWQHAFLFVGVGLFVLVIVAAQFLKRDPSEVGQVPYGVGLDIKGKAPSGALGLSLKQAFRTQKFWILAVTIFCFGFCHLTTVVHIVPYAIDRGISPESASIILASLNGAMTVGSIVVGLIADRVGTRRAYVTCICLLFTVVFLLLPIASPWLLSLFVMIMALGAGGVAVMESSLTAELFGLKSHGAILGCIVFSFTLGGSLGPFVGGSVFDSTGSYRWVFTMCGALLVVAIVLAVVLNRIRKIEALALSGRSSVAS
jgi:MFS family permease